MPKAEIRVGVLLCPDKKLEQAPPHSTWPRPAGVKVALTKQGAGGAAPVSVVTGADGFAPPTEVEVGRTYAVQVLSPGWDDWEAPTVKVGADRGDRLDVRLVPCDERRLLPVRLMRSDGHGHRPTGLGGVTICVNGREFGPASEAGDIYALAPQGSVDVQFKRSTSWDGKTFDPPYDEVTFEVPRPTEPIVEIPEFVYVLAAPGEPAREAPSEGAEISIQPKVKMPSGRLAPFTGASVTVELSSKTPGAVPAPGTEAVALTGTLAAGDREICFPGQRAGVFSGTVFPPETFNGCPVRQEPKTFRHYYLPAGGRVSVVVEFELGTTPIEGVVQSPLGRTLEQDLRLEVFCPGFLMPVAAKAGKFAARVPTGAPLKIRLAPGPAPTLGGIPLQMSHPEQDVVPPPRSTTVALEYQHGITGEAVDERGHPLPGAVVALYQGKDFVASAVANDDGRFLAGVKAAGDYDVAVQTEGGEPLTRRPVSVQSVANVGKVVFRTRGAVAGGPGRVGPGDADGDLPCEAFTDLAAYPVLTEEITTGGAAPAPRDGGPGSGYGQTVEQVIRDVLGWRPSPDATGFQSALAGAFQLREVEGHTEWSWQQRGYAVQADMGALTGAQASIYARAKSALDQIQPLLAGLAPIDPSLYPPQDLEAIRTIVASELVELVSELGVEGGPRIQRVNELFRLLLGEDGERTDLNPDHAQGQLGILRARFGLTKDKVNTLDEERLVTNFRVIAELVLALRASWNTDREQLSVVGPQASLGTILIWLSRSLEAVADSVGELTFALDSVFVDATQRQVIELRFAGKRVDVPAGSLAGPSRQHRFDEKEPPILLSDLLDWVVRASTDEGPKLIQDAGKEGVFAFAAVLEQLRTLIHAARQRVRHDHTLPAGMRTPRVDRALMVLAGQLDDAARLAGAVRRDEAPEIAEAWLIDSPTAGARRRQTQLPAQGPIWIALRGSDFRAPVSAVLTAEGRADLAVMPAISTHVSAPSVAYAQFPNPRHVPHSAGTTWLVSLTNDDTTQSNEIEVVRVPHPRQQIH
jgi:hypothetical protein